MLSREKFQRSRVLLGRSLQVIAKNRKLLVFPALGLLGSLLIGLIFLAPTLFEPTGFAWSQREHWTTLTQRVADIMPRSAGPHPFHLTTIMWVRFAAYYLLAMFSTTLVNVAFYNEIIQALSGECVSIRRGLFFAASRLRSILAWTLFAASVGLVLKLLSTRLGVVGRFVLGLIGVSWSVAAAFVIPVIIREENPNPLHLLKVSAATIKKTWGETVTGFIGIGSGLALVFIFPLLLTSHLYLRTGHATGTLVAVSLVWMFIGMELVRTTLAIYRCALYVYATEGVMPEPYDPELMDSAWTVKTTR